MHWPIATSARSEVFGRLDTLSIERYTSTMCPCLTGSATELVPSSYRPLNHQRTMRVEEWFTFPQLKFMDSHGFAA
jgi:hypothetical protein